MPGRPALEIEFDDKDAALLLDGEARPRDERLRGLLDWWNAIRGQSPLPIWSDAQLDQIGSAREIVHVYELQKRGSQIRVSYVAPSLVQMIGENPVGRSFSDAHSASENLRPTARRVFELVRLVQSTKEPLRACSKTFRRLAGGKFMAENLHLPFAGADPEVDVVLAATVYTPV